MKKTLFLLTCALTMTSAYAKTKVFSDMPRILGLNELSHAQIEDFVKSNDPNLVLECKEGSEVPLRYLVSNGILSLSIDPNLTIKVEKTFYLRVDHGKCYASFDLATWNKASKILDAGDVSVNVKINQTPNKPGYTIETTITPKESEEE